MERRSAHQTWFSHLTALGRWWSFVVLLASKRSGERFRLRHSDRAALLSIFEPLALVFALGYARQFISTGAPPFGSSTVLFIATGVLPYYMFYHTSQKIRGLDNVRNVPMAGIADNAIAYVLGEIATKCAIMAMLFFYLWMTGVPDAIPVNLLGCLPPLIAIAVMGAAVGVFNAVINSFFEAWHYFYGVSVRILMLFSAILFVLDFVPLSVRNVAVYNPLAQAITWFRSEFYGNYPAITLDIGYTMIVVTVMLLFAIVIEADTRRWRSSR